MVAANDAGGAADAAAAANRAHAMRRWGVDFPRPAPQWLPACRRMRDIPARRLARRRSPCRRHTQSLPAPRAAVGAGGAAVAPRPILVQPNDPQAADPAGSGGFYSSLSMPAARDAHPTRRKKKSVETTMAITIALLVLAVLCICFLVYYLNSANPWGSSAEDQPLFGPGRVVIEHKPAPAPAPPAVDTKIKADAKIKKASPVNQMVKPRAAVRRPPVKVIHGAEEDVGGDLKFTPHVEKPRRSSRRRLKTSSMNRRRKSGPAMASCPSGTFPMKI